MSFTGNAAPFESRKCRPTADGAVITSRRAVATSRTSTTGMNR
jgi:hypothetical protein